VTVKAYNGLSSDTDGLISLPNGGTSADNTATFSQAPRFPTIASTDLVKITVDPGTAIEEIVAMSPYTTGATTGTVIRAYEPTANGIQTKFAHTNSTWIHGPTAADYFFNPLTSAGDLVIGSGSQTTITSGLAPGQYNNSGSTWLTNPTQPFQNPVGSPASSQGFGSVGWYLGVDFGVPTAVGAAIVAAADTSWGGGVLSVQSSTDGTTWTARATHSPAQSDFTDHTYNFTTVTARYWRFIWTAGDANVQWNKCWLLPPQGTPTRLPLGAATALLSGDATAGPKWKTAGPTTTGPTGDASHVPVVSIDAYGRVTALTSVGVAGFPSPMTSPGDIIYEAGGSSYDLAAGQAMTTSGVDSGRVGANAVDGNDTTFWSGGGGNGQWIRFDAGSPISCNSFRVVVNAVNGAANFTTEWRLQGSTDNATWVTVSDQSGLAPTFIDHTWTFAPTTYRYWRLLSVAGITDRPWLNTWNLYTSAGVPVALPLGIQNKILTAGASAPEWDNNPAVQATVAVVAASGATQTIPDVVTAQINNITLTANCTFTFPTAAAGKRFRIFALQDATGGRTVTWPATVKWPGAAAPVLTTTAAKADLFAFECIDGTNWVGLVLGQNI
jgi:hypothetical protein